MIPLAQQIMDFFTRNPDEELLAVDVLAKFGGTLKTSQDCLTSLRKLGFVGARRMYGPKGGFTMVYMPRGSYE